MLSVEKIYNEYRRQIFYYDKQIYPRSVKNFDKIKSKSDWVFFERFYKIILYNGGALDYQLYIKSLVEFFKGRFSPKLLGHPKGNRIYRSYVNKINSSNDKIEIQNSILESINYVIKYMKDNNMKCWEDYISYDCNLLPIIAKHFKSGNISSHFLSIIPDILLYIRSFPQDVANEYFEDFINKYHDIKILCLINTKIRKIHDNFEKIINKETK